MGTKYLIGEKFQYITPDGVTFDFDKGMRAILTFEGLGLPAHDFITTQGPGQNGETVIGMRYKTRLIQLVYRENGEDRFDYWSIRKNLIKYLKPDRQKANTFQPGEFRVLMPDMTTRAIKVLLAEGMSFAPRNLDNYDEFGITEVFRFVAHNPFWFEPPGFVVTLQPNIVAPTHLTFPFTFRNPVSNQFGTDMQFNVLAEPAFSVSNTFTYPSERSSFPTLFIHGPVRSPVITNQTTHEKIKLNYEVASGETVTISLEYGYKAVNSDFNGDITGAVTNDSQLTTFHVAADPESSGGVNTMTFTGTLGINGLTQVQANFFNWYSGI
jgi:hypothetical protein